MSLTCNISFNDPLEQFEVTSFFRLCDFTFLTTRTVTQALVLAALGLFFFLYNPRLVSAYDFARNSLAELVKSTLRENLYIRQQQYFTARFYLFFTLLVANLTGLLPGAFTVTSSFIFTLFLSLTYFVGVNLVGAVNNGWNLINLFLPAGVPLATTPFLVLVEGVSYVARTLSLSIRLFANRRSGHALLKILIGFAFARGSSLILPLNLLAIRPWTIVTAVRFLEFLIAFLQTHVFCRLIPIYLNDNLQPTPH